jgi:hypothetical protein
MLDVCPRTLKVQAIESSAESTAASAFCAFSQSAISWRLAREDFAGDAVGMDDEPRPATARAVRPDRVDRVARTGTSSAPFASSAALRFSPSPWCGSQGS